MRVSLTPTELIDQLRAWFFPKDRSIYLADSCYVYLPGPHQVAMARITETTLGASAAGVTFANIPQTYRHLVLFCQARSDRVAESDIINWRANGDSGANYDSQLLLANDITVSSDALRAQTSVRTGITEAASSRASNFNPVIVYFPGYSLADREKWSTSLPSPIGGNVSADTDVFLAIYAGRWRSTAAITSITLLPNTGPNFVAGSIFTLYGIM